MFNRAQLESIFTLNAPADPEHVAAITNDLGIRVPDDYAAFLAISNGLYSGDRQALWIQAIWPSGIGTMKSRLICPIAS